MCSRVSLRLPVASISGVQFGQGRPAFAAAGPGLAARTVPVIPAVRWVAVFLVILGRVLPGVGFSLVGQGDVAHPGTARQGGDDEPFADEAAEAGGQIGSVDAEGARQVGVGDAAAVRKLRPTAMLPPQPVQHGLLKSRKFQFLVTCVRGLIHNTLPYRVWMWTRRIVELCCAAPLV